MIKINKLILWIRDKSFFVKKKRKKYSRIIVGGNPVGYYIESIKWMCSVWQKNIKCKTMGEECLTYFLPQLKAARQKYYYEDAYEAIDKCLRAMYNYSKEMGYIEPSTSFDDFYKERRYIKSQNSSK